MLYHSVLAGSVQSASSYQLNPTTCTLSSACVQGLTGLLLLVGAPPQTEGPVSLGTVQRPQLSQTPAQQEQQVQLNHHAHHQAGMLLL
jgi:hypothetical protein